eukprot:m.852008 g.852008  ORF g.852008 m.852008 type:complete len:94 (+) comp59595_c0_seq10:347-628(+)
MRTLELFVELFAFVCTWAVAALSSQKAHRERRLDFMVVRQPLRRQTWPSQARKLSEIQGASTDQGPAAGSEAVIRIAQTAIMAATQTQLQWPT